MFGFVNVNRYEDDNMIIDTCYASDTGLYETGISSIYYNNAEWIIVEEYDTKYEAIEGHKEWIKKMTSKILPKSLEDVSTGSDFKFKKQN